MPHGHALKLFVAVVLLLAAGCGRSDSNGEYVARVGDHYLTQADVSDQLRRLPVAGDSLEARDQIIEQWVANELLYNESRRRGIRNDRDVQRQLEENERSVMVSALISRMYEEEASEVSQAEIAATYEREKDRLRLREPFVQVRYLATNDPNAANEARQVLTMPASDSDAETLWLDLVDTHAADPAMSSELQQMFTAESRLFPAEPRLRSTLTNLRDGQASQVIEIDEQYHVMQLVQRVPAGSIPELAWVQEELTRRQLIQNRKQLYARQVQRLRNEALAREDLEIRYLDSPSLPADR